MNRSSVSVLLVGVTLLGALSGCKKQNSEKNKMDGFISATEQLPRAFTYVDDDQKKQLAVVGVVGDSFRYKARLLVNGAPAWEEVVSDDAVADRFIDPHLLIPAASHLLASADSGVLAQAASVLDAAPLPVAQGSAINPVDVLRTRRWLLDRSGAPMTTGSSTNQTHRQGDDPIYDSVTALEFVRQAASASAGVVKYDPEGFEHPYKASEDPFPKPSKSGGIVRYDLRQVPLPQRSATGPGATPKVESFRKMAIYIKAGHVVEVREVIDVLNRLPELARLQQVDVPKGLSSAGQIQFATELFNRSVGVGGDKLRPRSMTFRLLDLGVPQEVALPVDNVVEGSATVLPFRGKAGPAKAGSAGTPALGFTAPAIGASTPAAGGG